MPDSAPLHFLVRKRTTFTWIVPLALLVATYYWGHWSPVAYAAGIVLILLGEAVRFWAAGYIHKDDIIANDGPYGMVRNPLYLGSLLLAVGYTAMSGLGWIAWILVIGLFLLFHLAAIISEEQFLKTKFGEPYEAYLRSVPRLIPVPKFGKSGKHAGGHFSPQQAINNREHITLAISLVTAFAFAILHIVRTGHIS